MKFIYTRFLSMALALLAFAFHVSAQQASYESFRPLLLKNSAKLGISATDVADAVITNAYTDEKIQITYIYLQQTYSRIKVYNSIVTTAFRNGSFLYASGGFVKDIAAKAGSTTPSKSSIDAVRAASRHLGLNETTPLAIVSDLFAQENKYSVAAPGIARRNIDVTLFWQPTDDYQQVALTWNVNIDVAGSNDWWNVRINSQTGNYVTKDNWTVSEHNQDQAIIPQPSKIFEPSYMQFYPGSIPAYTKNNSEGNVASSTNPPPTVTSANYRVYPYPVESPNYGPASSVNNPWTLAGVGNNATTNGWHFDGTNNYDITRGNNVFATLDRRANNAVDATRNWPDTSTTGNPTLNFVHSIVPAAQPWLNTENKKAALDNLFYWNNIMHDIHYQYGLTEQAGVFQADNIGRGGVGNDAVAANAQDSAGYNNANFSTPTDGTSGRMQMYTWSAAPIFTVSAPESISGNYAGRESSFSLNNKLVNVGPVTANVAWYNNDAGGTVHTGCVAAANASALVGKIALIEASGCTFASKVKNAQNAGAVAVLMYYPTILGLGGTDNTITIPCISITLATANLMIAQLNASQTVTATLATGIYLDGDLDNGIIAHEYGHGISNRLTGGGVNTSCLTNAEQGGEGWSDYFALMVTTDWNTAALTDGPNLRPVGTYAYDQGATGAGIRRYPYSTNMSVNPLTYADMALNTEVHATGEIWTAALWDMTWNIIAQQGSITGNLYNSAGTGGNVIALNLVMTGLKLQPCGPGFIDARNAILTADSLLYGYAHKCAIWNAFARRGMGFSASQGSAASAADQTTATNVPSAVKISRAPTAIVTQNTQTTLLHTVTCECQAVSGYVVRDTIPAGFTYVSSSPSGTLNGNVLSFPGTAFAANEAKTFSITLQAPASGCAIDSVINDNRDGSAVGSLTSSGTPGFSASTAKPFAGSSSWLGVNSAAASSSKLTSVNTTAGLTQPLSVLSFYHYFNTENTFDGGIIEYSTDGVLWNDALPYIYQGTYNRQMTGSGGPLVGRKAFSGTNTTYQQTLLNLSSFGITPVAFRFRLDSDAGVGGEGWYIDNIVRANGCGGILKTGVYNASSVRQDSLVQAVFVSPGTIPLKLLWFYANQVGSQVALNWKTASEVNVKNFSVEWSTDGTNWSGIGAVAAKNGSADNNYDLLHANPVKGNNYYRLKMNDIDGQFTYSPIRIINMRDKGMPALVLVPNPANSDATLYIDKDLNARNIRIFNAAGSLVRKASIIAGTQQIKISTAELASGVYTIETDGTSRNNTRMIVQH